VAAALSPSGLAAMNPPHLRHRIFRCGEDNHLWVFGAHHIAADAISLKLYAETFRLNYARAPDSSLRTTSIEYAQTQRAWLDSESAQEELVWWLRRLEPIPRGELPVRPPRQSSEVWLERQELRLSVEIRDAVLRAARSSRSPPAAVFLAAYAQTIDQRRHRSTHVVLTNVPSRNLAGAASTSGACYNTVPLLLAAADCASEAISAAANAIFDALDHQGVPAPLISLGCVRQGDLAITDRAPVTFNVIDHPLGDFRLPGCRLSEVELTSLEAPAWGYSGPMVLRSSKPPIRPSMDWLVSLLPSSVVLTVEYTPSYADREDVTSLLSEYEATLCRLCNEPVRDVFTGEPGIVADWTGSP
jgi:Condensation domain